MGAALSRTIVPLAAIWAVILTSAEAGESVVLRAGNGRFLRATEDGAVRADRLFPATQETFELVPCQDDHIALRAHNGCLLVAEGRIARSLRADSPRVEPDDRETFLLVPAGENCVALKARNCPDFIAFGGSGSKTPEPQQSDGPGPEETVEIYRAGEVPLAIRTALAVVIHALVMEELEGEEYDKLKTRKKVKYIELPAPTLRDPRRMKKHRVLSMTEEYHIKARLDGSPEIQIKQMPYLKGYRRPEVGLLMFVVRASLPVRGSVRYKIPERLSASTGFRTVVGLSMVGEVRAERSDDQVSLSPPELLELRVELRGLDISNDVLNAVRRQIEDLINHEIRDQKDRIRRKANKSLRKGVEAREFRHPLLRYLTFP